MFQNLARRARAIFSQKSEVSINGVNFEGSNVDIVGNRVLVDGKPVDFGPTEALARIVIHISGNCEVVTTQSGDVTVSGDVSNGIGTQSGSVRVDGEARGNINTMSGDVTVHGSIQQVKTMSGNITTR